MKISCLAMVRNEGDIIELFCRHVSALFDDIVVIDHASEDGTRQYLDALARSDRRFHVYEFAEPAYEQSALMTFAARTLPALVACDWLFLLDADEFLPFADRGEFVTRLEQLAGNAVIEMRWSNLVPCDYTEGTFNLSGPMWRNDEAAIHRKIAFRPVKLKHLDYCIAQGNHSLLEERGGNAVEAVASGFPLFHIPIRSPDQFSLKLAQGIAAYALRNRSADPLEGFHWASICDISRGAGLEPDVLNWLAATYGAELGREPQHFGTDELKKLGYEQGRLELALDSALSAPRDLRSPAETMLRVCTRFAEDASHGPRSDLVIALAVDDANRIYATATRSNKVFSALPSADWPIHDLAAEREDDAFVWRFLRPAFWPIKCLTPSAWAGHIPFMFCLVAALKPRRYVELGTHHGASFFAACQAAQRASPESECVAVDTWIGDEHAGFYGDSIFDTFQQQLKHHFSDIGEHLRCTFDEAVANFEPGSIDLLHIDGLHTYEAVKHDFETWKDRLTPDGVVIFHDVNVHERDFGVWELWTEVREQYPTMTLPHSHGLGVLCLSDNPRNPIVRLIRVLQANPSAGVSIQWFLQNVGELSALRSQAVDFSAQNHDLKLRQNRLEHDKACTECEHALRQIRASTSWRITAPLRFLVTALRRLIKGS